MSQNQLLFLQAEKKRKLLIRISRALVLLGFLVIWELSARCGLIDVFFYSCPTRIARCFLEMTKENQLFLHIGVSLYETILSFFIIMLGSVLTASLLWRFQTLSSVVEPVFVLLNSLPKSALAPLIIVWLGTGIRTIVIAGISVAIFGCIINLYTCFKNTDSEKQKLIRILGGKKRHIFFMVVLPAARETILSNMKVNIGLALVGVMIGEFLAARQGLGYLIIYASQVFKLDWLILCILILCFIAVCLYSLIQMIERRLSVKI